MRRISVIFWLVIVMIAIAFLNLGLNFKGYDLTQDSDSSDLMITFKTQKYRGSYNSLSNYYEHYGISSRFTNHGITLCVGIIAPIVVILLALLFEPVIVKRLGKATGETSST